MSLERFSRRMAIREKKFPGKVGVIVKKVALAVAREVVRSTPVDTGKARSNWLTSLGTSRTNEIPPYNPLPQGTNADKINETANAAGAIDQAESVISKRKSEQDIHITNNVDYIGDLNAGSSRQAPEAFVEKAVMAGIVAFKGAKLGN